MQKRKLGYEEQIAEVKEYKTGKVSRAYVAKKYGTSETALRDAINIYEFQGEEGLLPKKHNKKYSAELKLQAVTEYLSGKVRLLDICKKYKILSNKQLRQWIKLYNGHKELRNPSGSGTEINMTEGIKTTQQERAEIVAFCIAHGKDYALTIQRYGVSYQQIYAWVNKYETKGIDGLVDGRGKSKTESEMTESDKLKAENKILAARIKDLEMENALIKKLGELERGGR